MTANSMEELNAMLIKDLNKAMGVTSEKTLADMYDETGKFYTGKQPKVYQRTGALGDTPKTTAVTVSSDKSGGSASFDAYLDIGHKYSTGSMPGMQEVLNLANSGIRFTTKNGYPAKDTVGKKHFWERAEKNMEKTLNSTLKKFFK